MRGSQIYLGAVGGVYIYIHIYICKVCTVCTMNNTIRKGKNKSSVTVQYISVFVCHRDCAGHTRTV